MTFPPPRVFGRGRHVVSVCPAEGGGWDVAVDDRPAGTGFTSLDTAWAAGASEAARLDAVAARARREAHAT